MQSKNDQLVVRQHERLLCSLRALVRISEANSSQIAIARTVGDGNGSLNATIVDCSRGGLGLQTLCFLPRSCMLSVLLPTDEAAGITSNLELFVRVQRSSMIDRTPTYYLGVSFRVPGPPQTDRIDRLLALASGVKPAPKAAGTDPPGDERKVA